MSNFRVAATPPNRETPKEVKPNLPAKTEIKKPEIKRPEIKRNAITLSISTEVLGQTKLEEINKGVAYVFSKGGTLLGKANLTSQGTAKVNINLPATETTQSLRLILGPSIEENITITELLRLGGEQKYVQLPPKTTQKELSVQLVPNQILCWLLSKCIVQGKVLKKVISGGISMELPVCNATVEIYEVDPIPILIPKLPIETIEHIREFIIKPPPPRPPFKEEYIEETPIGPLPPQPLTIGTQPTQQAPLLQNKTQATTSTRLLMLEPYLLKESPILTLPSNSETQKLKLIAQTTNTEQFRQALINNADFLKNIICLFPFITTHMDLVATATTAECGKFKATFYRGCKNPDIPDLYFKVKQQILPLPFFPKTTIYEPKPVYCHTYWNYQCGTQEVTLYVTHPLARVCPPCPPINAPLNWVLFMAIGNRPLSKIRGTATALTSTTTTENLGLTEADAPFGETLRPRIEFDNSLRETLGIKYYQLSYRKGTTGKFIPLTATVNRHYTHEVDGDLVLEVYNLGPKQEKSPSVPLNTQNLFEIPPALPPTGQWSIPDAVEDTANAKFQTLNLAPLQNPGIMWPESGIYQIKLDLFDEDGNLVNINDLDIQFRVPTSTDLSGTIETENAADTSLTNTGMPSPAGLIQDDDEDGKKSMIIALHIDNSRCKAEIPAPNLDGTAAGDDCGVMKYETGSGPLKEPQGDVQMFYRPEHPAGVGTKGFANYTFTITRGGNPETTIDPLQPTPMPPTTKSTTMAAKDLLGTCETAGFVEHMHVYATATSGWRTLYEYDAHAVRGFVLAPKKTSGPP